MCVSLATHNISLVNAGFIEITVISPVAHGKGG